MSLQQFHHRDKSGELSYHPPASNRLPKSQNDTTERAGTARRKSLCSVYTSFTTRLHKLTAIFPDGPSDTSRHQACLGNVKRISGLEKVIPQTRTHQGSSSLAKFAVSVTQADEVRADFSQLPVAELVKSFGRPSSTGETTASNSAR